MRRFPAMLFSIAIMGAMLAIVGCVADSASAFDTDFQAGLIGLSQQELMNRFKRNVADAPSDPPPTPPAVGQMRFSLSANQYCVLGLDHSGRVIYVKPTAREDASVSPQTVRLIMKTVANDWQVDAYASRAYPDFQTLHTYTREVDRWIPEHRGSAIEHLESEQVPVKKVVILAQKQVMFCSDGVACSICEIKGETNSPTTCWELEIADANTFWTWRFDELIRLCKQGLPKSDGPNYNPKHMRYEQHLEHMMGNKDMECRFLTKRLVMAVVAAIYNPRVELRVLAPAIQFLRQRAENDLKSELNELAISAEGQPRLSKGPKVKSRPRAIVSRRAKVVLGADGDPTVDLAAAEQKMLKELQLEAAEAEAAGQIRYRIWIDNAGKYLTEAVLVDMKGDQVRVKQVNGKTVLVDRNRLSEMDQSYLRRKAH
jgi:hypothetical protein